MAKEIDRAGIPVIQVCTIVSIAETVGSNRIEKAVAIPYPCGNPTLPLSEQEVLKRKIVETALKGLECNVTDKTLFEY